MNVEIPDDDGGTCAGGPVGRVDRERPVGTSTVTIVFLVHNRREELRVSLRQMLFESGYDPELLDVIVVDNASTDNSFEMVEAEFPQARLIQRKTNCGVSAWNDGFAQSSGDYVLALDDDCYLPPGGLSHAIASAKEHDADLVSFAIGQPNDSDFRFNELYRTGMLSFWGCAVLIRRRVLERLSGYDPAIFIWANELEFMLRFFDSGFRHLHLPEVVAVHMKDTSGHWMAFFSSDSYRINAENFAYIAAKLLRPREAAEALVARLATHFKDAIRVDGAALRALPYCLRGFARGLRHRQPVTNSEISRVYRRNFQSFASPWWLLRPLPQFLRHGPGELARTRWRSGQKESRFLAGRREAYFIERPRYYPRTSSTLEFEAP